ncbi:MAG: peptidylprolyl isomerase [PVC group bacterium]
MKKKSIGSMAAFFAVAALGIILFACGEKSPENILVKVDDSVITLDEFKKEWLRQPPPPPGEPQEPVDQFINDMIAEKLFLIEARRRKLDQDEKFRGEVEKYREQLMVETLLNQEVLTVDRPGQNEIEEYWANNKAAFTVPELTRFSHILVKAGEGETEEEALARCLEIKKRLDTGADFADVAREVSEGSSAARGGDLGYYRPGQISPEFKEAAGKLEIGEVSEPLRTDYGCHLVAVTDRKPPREKTLEESQDEVVAILLAAQRKGRFDTVKSRLASESVIWMNTDLIDHLRAEQRKALQEAR